MITLGPAGARGHGAVSAIDVQIATGAGPGVSHPYW
jgi:hypothetical protein